VENPFFGFTQHHSSATHFLNSGCEFVVNYGVKSSKQVPAVDLFVTHRIKQQASHIYQSEKIEKSQYDLVELMRTQ
jgi:hypothetical protein